MSFVEKVHLLEEHILRLCNLIVPNSAENQCPNIRIDFDSLNQISLPTIGFYGDKRTMGRILKEMGVLDHSIHKQMEEDKLEPELLQNMHVKIHQRDIYVLKQAAITVQNGFTSWKSSSELLLENPLKNEWDGFVMALFQAGIHLTEDEDGLAWGYNIKCGSVTARHAYILQVQQGLADGYFGWLRRFWSWRTPLKMKCFTWLAFFDKILTWPNLQKRGFEGPAVCCLCRGGGNNLSFVWVLLLFPSYLVISGMIFGD